MKTIWPAILRLKFGHSDRRSDLSAFCASLWPRVRGSKSVGHFVADNIRRE